LLALFRKACDAKVLHVREVEDDFGGGFGLDDGTEVGDAVLATELGACKDVYVVDSHRQCALLTPAPCGDLGDVFRKHNVFFRVRKLLLHFGSDAFRALNHSF